MTSGHSIFTSFRRLTGCNGTLEIGVSSVVSELRYKITCSVLGMGLRYSVAV